VKEHNFRSLFNTVSTPAAIVMLDTFESNTDDMRRRLEGSQVSLRPHIKVHRIPELGRLQATPGASGIACQTLDEVEIMVENGFGEILLTNSLVDDRKLRRFMRLSSQAFVAITAESDEAIEALVRVAEKSGRRVSVYVECDIGGARTGYTDPSLATALAIRIARSSTLEFSGLAGYLGGNPSCSDIEGSEVLLGDVVSRLADVGVDVPAVSVGGTVFAMRAWPHCPPSTVTEARPGNYSFYDTTKVDFGLVDYQDCALRVISTVVSRPNPTRMVLDVGWRMLSNNTNPARSTFGHILEYPHAMITRLYTEHAVVELPTASTQPQIGDLVSIVPNSCDGLLASIDTLYGIRGNHIERVWSLWERAVST
jgi:D-serine deaminase-like pyridoxal phosphate-dependent protein